MGSKLERVELRLGCADAREVCTTWDVLDWEMNEKKPDDLI